MLRAQGESNSSRALDDGLPVGVPGMVSYGPGDAGRLRPPAVAVAGETEAAGETGAPVEPDLAHGEYVNDRAGVRTSQMPWSGRRQRRPASSAKGRRRSHHRRPASPP